MNSETFFNLERALDKVIMLFDLLFELLNSVIRQTATGYDTAERAGERTDKRKKRGQCDLVHTISPLSIHPVTYSTIGFLSAFDALFVILYRPFVSLPSYR